MHGIYTLRYACEKRDGRTVCLRMPGVGCRDRAEKDGHGVPPPKRAFYSCVCFPVRIGCRSVSAASCRHASPWQAELP